MLSVLNLYRACAVCQSSFGYLDWFPIKWLCCFCKKQFFQTSSIKLQTVPLYKGSVYSLIRWNHQNNAYLSPLIQSLKGNYNHIAWHIVVQAIIRELLLNNLLDRLKVDVIIPAPSHNSDRQHAHILAKALGHQLNISVDLNVLQFKTKGQKSWFYRNRSSPRQTFKSKAERANIQMLAQRHKHKKILFVDDICTTGATISVAHQALGHPSCFYPFVLANKVMIK